MRRGTARTKALWGSKDGRRAPLCRQHLLRRLGLKWDIALLRRVCRLRSSCPNNNRRTRRNNNIHSIKGSFFSILSLCSNRWCHSRCSSL
jgi:hypothetical protein